MLKHNEIRKGKIIELNGDPYEVTKYSHVVKGRGRSVVQTQLRNLKNNSVLQKTFHAGDSVEEAELEKMNIVFVYSHRGKYFFQKEEYPSFRFELAEEQLEEEKKYLLEKTPLTAVLYDEKVIGISLPIKMTFRVKEAPPGTKGDRAEGGTKVVVLETGATVDVPLFVDEGDVVEVNTETGEYVRRVQ